VITAGKKDGKKGENSHKGGEGDSNDSIPKKSAQRISQKQRGEKTCKHQPMGAIKNLVLGLTAYVQRNLPGSKTRHAIQKVGKDQGRYTRGGRGKSLERLPGVYSNQKGGGGDLLNSGSEKNWKRR